MRPYKHLWANVLWQAVMDAVGHVRATRNVTRIALQRDARAWFASNDDGIGSFLWLCELLHLSPCAVRSRVVQMAAEVGKPGYKMPRFLVQMVS